MKFEREVAKFSYTSLFFYHSSHPSYAIFALQKVRILYS